MEKARAGSIEISIKKVRGWGDQMVCFFLGLPRVRTFFGLPFLETEYLTYFKRSPQWSVCFLIPRMSSIACDVMFTPRKYSRRATS